MHIAAEPGIDAVDSDLLANTPYHIHIYIYMCSSAVFATPPQSHTGTNGEKEIC